MSNGAWWGYTRHCDTSGNSGTNSNSVTLGIPQNNIFATATLSNMFINSSGGSATATIDSFQLQEPDGPISPHIPVNAPILWANDAVTVTFTISCYAQSAGFGFSNGANADGVFTTTLWGG
jgi:hypothetical protein